MPESPDLSQPENETLHLKVAIVGGGKGAESFLKMVAGSRLGRFQFEVVGIADINLDTPGIQYARELGVELITNDLEELFRIPNLELLIELTGDQLVRDFLERSRPRHIKFVDSFGANLFWELFTAEEGRIRQRAEMTRILEEEHQWIMQVFDAIPDEIMVIDTDCTVTHANAVLLNNNNLTIDQVRGRYCYDLSLARGECAIGLKSCLFQEVMTTKKVASTVRQDYDENGKTRYVTIMAAPLLDTDGEPIGMIESSRNITHRIQLEEELKATEDQLRKIMDLAPVATYVKDLQGRYLDVNEATCRLYNRSKQEILGKTDLEIMDRDTAKVMRASDKRVVKQGTTLTIEEEVRLVGRDVCMHTIKFPLYDTKGKVNAVCGLSNDITGLKTAERDLRTTRDYLQNILNNSPVMVITTDMEGRIVSYNKGAEDALGYSYQDVAGQPASALYVRPEERGSLLRRVINEGAVRDYETTFVRKDGSTLQVSLTISQLKNSDGEIIGTVGMTKDISQRKALMNQVMQSERLAAVGRLAAGVAHEINNPLAVISEISGFLDELIKADPVAQDPETIEELVTGLPKIMREVKRCRSITKRMLSFASKTEMREEVTDVKKAMEEILPFLEKQARLSNVTIHQDYDLNLPHVRIEEMQLQEIFINLINNAIHAVHSNGKGNIWISTGLEEGKVRVSIKDDGPGISEKVMDRLFDPFVTTKPTGQGTGLGLSICYGIVKRYDGQITVDSKPGQGATFNVILPVHQG